jgi:hypothetical protein
MMTDKLLENPLVSQVIAYLLPCMAIKRHKGGRGRVVNRWTSNCWRDRGRVQLSGTEKRYLVEIVLF